MNLTWVLRMVCSLIRFYAVVKGEFKKDSPLLDFCPAGALKFPSPRVERGLRGEVNILKNRAKSLNMTPLGR